jgi:predicted enzyme related to lactoylglutathione lyase
MLEIGKKRAKKGGGRVLMEITMQGNGWMANIWVA